ncbi:hypothetical protein OH76DRAFT_454311 [Lentinus brumalis]|uniref:Uncharacterized protein n=1 Tax=Lentinus brumalis TaxID=2498619 RepID=A0A371DDB4_9APHY|nr:hypothetical protein OH76DRAFT_454311 [Polyporus brumalis]
MHWLQSRHATHMRRVDAAQGVRSYVCMYSRSSDSGTSSTPSRGVGLICWKLQMTRPTPRLAGLPKVPRDCSVSPGSRTHHCKLMVIAQRRRWMNGPRRSRTVKCNYIMPIGRGTASSRDSRPAPLSFPYSFRLESVPTLVDSRLALTQGKKD